MIDGSVIFFDKDAQEIARTKCQIVKSFISFF